MTSSHSNLLLKHLKQMICTDDTRHRTDGELLRRFLHKNDESAFTQLVQRHSTMVWEVCRSLLGRHEDAEDVFQATFLVLNRSAASIRKQAALAGWLHGVAFRLAQKYRDQNRRQVVPQSNQLDQLPARPTEDVTWRELRHILHEELHQLPEKNRLPIVLCHLEELTQDEAAHRLGWTVGQLRGRLLRGRDMLRSRLARRGIDLSAGILAAVYSQSKAGAARTPALGKFLHQARSYSSASMNHGNVFSPKSLQLADGLLFPTWKLNYKLVSGLVLFFCIVGGAVGLLIHQSSALTRRGNPSTPTPAAPPSQNDQKQKLVRKDALDDPLPPNALLRLGTIRLRHGGAVHGLLFSADGTSLLSGGGGDSKIRRWEVTTGKELSPISGPKEGFITVAVSADGKTLAAGGLDRKIHIYERASGKQVRQIPGPGSKLIADLALSATGELLVTGGQDRAVRLWDVATGRQLRHLDTYKRGISCVGISPDGKLIASAAYDKAARIMETASGKEVFRLKAKAGSFYALRFSPDSETILTGEKDAVCLWDARTGQQLRRIDGLKGSVRALCFAADGKRFAAGGPQTFRIWQTKTGKELHRIHGHPDTILSLTFSPDGKTLASGGTECAIRLWNTQTGKSVHDFPGHPERVTAVAASPDGQVVATAGWDQTIRLWNIQTGKELRKFDYPQTRALPNDIPTIIDALVFSPDSKIIAAAGNYDNVVLFDLTTGKQRWKRFGSGVDISPDGKLFAVGGQDKIVRIHEMASGKELRRLQGHISPISGVKFSPDGTTLATISYGAPIGLRVPGEEFDKQAVWLWNLSTGKVRMRLGIPRAPGSLAFSSDGRMLATTGRVSKGVTLWETATGKKRGDLLGHQKSIFDVAFSPDGRLLASASMDTTIRLWYLPTGKEIGRLEGHRAWVHSVAFAEGGRKLVSGSLDTTGLIWKTPKRLIDFRPKPITTKPGELEKLWEDLAREDAVKAYQAISALVASAEQAIPFLAKRLEPAKSPDPKRVAKLIADLDSKIFAIRARATSELEELAELAETEVRRALAKPPSLEVRQRVAKLLAKLETGVPSPKQLQALRAVEALEYIAAPEAQSILKTLSMGKPDARLTQQAAASLRRLSSRTSTPHNQAH